jgi:hypothetical protein
MVGRQKLQELARLDAADIGTSEENVKQKFLVPLLEALGHERKHLDFERPTQGRRIDVFIQGLKSDCKVIIDIPRMPTLHGLLPLAGSGAFDKRGNHPARCVQGHQRK